MNFGCIFVVGEKNKLKCPQKALDMMAEADRAALQMINMSGLYRTIWEEIDERCADRRMEVIELLKRKIYFSLDTIERETQLTEIHIAAEQAAYEMMNACVSWLALEVRERGDLDKIAGIRIEFMCEQAG